MIVLSIVGVKLDVRLTSRDGDGVPVGEGVDVMVGASVIEIDGEGVLVGEQGFPSPGEGSSNMIQSNSVSVSASAGHLPIEAPSNPKGIAGWKRSKADPPYASKSTISSQPSSITNSSPSLPKRIEPDAQSE